MSWDGYFAESDYDDNGNWRAGPPMPTPKTIDSDHPRYREGERAARVLLDLGIQGQAQDVRSMLADVELVAALAHGMGDEDQFLRATGMRVALYEYLQELGC